MNEDKFIQGLEKLNIECWRRHKGMKLGKTKEISGVVREHLFCDRCFQTIHLTVDLKRDLIKKIKETKIPFIPMPEIIKPASPQKEFAVVE